MKHIITLSLLAIAVSMTASITPSNSPEGGEQKPCCKKEAKPCCKKDTATCCDSAKADTLTLHMECNKAPQL